jgi:predicted RNase H-like HicB family nuclease
LPIVQSVRKNKKMKVKMTMIYWKGEKFWLGKLMEHPEIMTQGETLE